MTLLDTVRSEIATEESRHAAVMEKLREIEHLALGLAGTAMKPPPVAEKVKAPKSAPVAKARKKPAARRPKAANLFDHPDVREVVSMLRDGPLSKRQLGERSKTHKSNLDRACRRLVAAGKIEMAGRESGHAGTPSPIFRLAGDAARPVEDATAPVREEPDPEPQEKPEPPLPAAVAPTEIADDDAESRERVRNEHADAKDALSERILDALKAGDRTLNELAGELEVSKPSVLAAGRGLMASGRVQSFGAERDGSPIWRRVPLPSEREDVAIHNGNGAVSEAQVLECLRNGAYSIVEMARELEATPGEVALEISKLERAGRAEKIAGGKYMWCGVGAGL